MSEKLPEMEFVLSVKFDTLGEMTAEELHDMIRLNIERGIGGGILTGNTGAEVDVWKLTSTIKQ